MQCRATFKARSRGSYYMSCLLPGKKPVQPVAAGGGSRLIDELELARRMVEFELTRHLADGIVLCADGAETSDRL